MTADLLDLSPSPVIDRSVKASVQSSQPAVPLVPVNPGAPGDQRVDWIIDTDEEKETQM